MMSSDPTATEERHQHVVLENAEMNESNADDDGKAYSGGGGRGGSCCINSSTETCCDAPNEEHQEVSTGTTSRPEERNKQQYTTTASENATSAPEAHIVDEKTISMINASNSYEPPERVSTVNNVEVRVDAAAQNMEASHPWRQQQSGPSSSSLSRTTTTDNTDSVKSSSRSNVATVTVVGPGRAADTHVLDEIQDLKWKLYGKNMYFSILFDAVITIQAFVRGCLCRGRVADRIDDLIQALLERREDKKRQEQLWEQYKQQDLLERQRLDGLGYGNNRRITDKVYKPWKYHRPESSYDDLSPFEELLLDRNKAILRQEEEGEDGQAIQQHDDGSTRPGNDHQEHEKLNDIDAEHSTMVEIVDVAGISLSQRLKLWNNCCISSSMEGKQAEEEGSRLDINECEEGQAEEVDGDQQETIAVAEENLTTQNKSGFEDSSSSCTSDHRATKSISAASSSTYISGSHSITSSIDTEVHNNYASNHFHRSHHAMDRHRSSTSTTILTRNRPWMKENVSSTKSNNNGGENDDDDGDPNSILQTFMEEDSSFLVEPGGKGYSRYRSNTKGRNKQRPWRDDTNVFDAY